MNKQQHFLLNRQVADKVKTVLLGAIETVPVHRGLFDNDPAENDALTSKELERRAMQLLGLGLAAHLLIDNVDRKAALTRCQCLLVDMTEPYGFRIADVASFANAAKSDPRMVLRHLKAVMKNVPHEYRPPQPSGKLLLMPPPSGSHEKK